MITLATDTARSPAAVVVIAGAVVTAAKALWAVIEWLRREHREERETDATVAESSATLVGAATNWATELRAANQELEAKVNTLEQRISDLDAKLDRESDARQRAEHRAAAAERRVRELEARLT